MKDYRRLKQDENSRLSLDWNLNRALSKVNYLLVSTESIRRNFRIVDGWSRSIWKPLYYSEKRKFEVF